MKRIFLGLLIIVGLFSVTTTTLAVDSTIQKIYKVESYKWDEIDKDYNYLGHGSAVLIGDNKIITNAHVILDSDDVPTGNYNLCISSTFESKPNCKTSLKLISYDKTNDLAILEPVEQVTLGTPLELSSRKLELGETARVYGYPANGGQTITLTEGKVSGFDDNHYKIDANIDAGNSGGGAFDKDGKFIGIPYVASVGYSTLGYIIPVSMIQDFLAGRGDIVNYGKVDSKFVKHVNKINAILQVQKIDNDYIGFDGFSKAGFTLDSAKEKMDSFASAYILYSKSRNTAIFFGAAEIYGKKFIDTPLEMEKLKQQYATVLEKKNFTIGGKKIYRLTAFVGEKKEDGTVDKNMLSLVFDLENNFFSISTKNYGAEKKNINAAISLFVKNFKIKKDIPFIDTGKFTTISGSFDVIDGINIINGFGATTFEFDSIAKQDGSISVYKYYNGEGEDAFDQGTFEKYGEDTLSYENEDEDILTQGEIKKNSLGSYHLAMSYTGTKTTTFTNIFFAKIGNAIYKTIVSYTIPNNSPELEKKYQQFIDTVKLTGDMPFKSATVGKIKVEATGSGTTTP